MKTILISMLCLAVSYGTHAQKKEISEAQKVWALYQTFGNKQSLEKQIDALTTGLEHTDKAITHEKSKTMPSAWSVRALLASVIAYIDTVNASNMAAKAKIAEEAIAQAKSLDTKNQEKEYIAAAEQNLNAALINGSLRAYNKKDYESALIGFDKILARNPNDTSMYINAGLTAKTIKKYPEAIGYYKKAISLNAKESKVLYGESINITLQELKDTASALALLDIAIAKYPDDVDLISIQTDIYINQGDIEKSRAALNKLLAKEPGKSIYNFLLGNTYFKQAQDLQEKRKKIDPKKKAEYDAITKKMTALVDQSIPYFKKSLETDPKYIPALETLKNIYAFKVDTKSYEEISKRLKEAEASVPKKDGQ